jgi:hypothetical protein
MTLIKIKFAIVAILILLATFIMGLGVHRIRLERRKADLYATGEIALAAPQWDKALTQFKMGNF